MKVFILLISNNEGYQITAHATEELARAAVNAYVEQFWERECEDTPMPDDLDERFEMYFDDVTVSRAAPDESYEIQECAVEGMEAQ